MRNCCAGVLALLLVAGCYPDPDPRASVIYFGPSRLQIVEGESVWLGVEFRGVFAAIEPGTIRVESGEMIAVRPSRSMTYTLYVLGEDDFLISEEAHIEVVDRAAESAIESQTE